ncbi:MAG: lysozyme inhibitor LprI family protein [Janthinobacterium lividum]
MNDPAVRRFSVCLGRGLLLAALAGAAGSAGAGAQAGPHEWLLSYQGKSTNALIWDKRTRRLVETRVPAKLSRLVLAGLGGPPGPVVVSGGRFVAASACVAHACPDKGFFWIDAKTGVGLGAYFGGTALQLGSNGMQAGAIPADARRAVLAWLAEQELRPMTVEFIGRSGKPTALPPASFTPPGQVQPRPGGPSFDCARAATPVEKAICADPALASQDLALARLVKEVGLGHATVDAREQLRTLQRRWIRERDTACSAPSGRTACLAAQYRAQHERIANWAPSNAAR